MDLVSVIIPTYNRSALVTRAVDSALAQTYRAIEIIVIDDGSIDGTAEMLANYASRIRMIRQTNKGRSSARNRGLHAARGQYIAFLDSDDFWARDKISRQVAALTRHGDADVCYTWAVVVDMARHFLRAFGPTAEGDVFERLYTNNFLTLCTVMARRACFFRDSSLAVAFDPALTAGEDWKLWLQLATAHRFCCVPEFLAFYTDHPHGTYQSEAGDRLAADSRAIESFLREDPALRSRLKMMGRRADAAMQNRIAYSHGRRGERGRALREYIRALKADPWFWPIYAGVLQVILGRSAVDRFIRTKDEWTHCRAMSEIARHEAQRSLGR